jgi:hypothetical protein
MVYATTTEKRLFLAISCSGFEVEKVGEVGVADTTTYVPQISKFFQVGYMIIIKKSNPHIISMQSILNHFPCNLLFHEIKIAYCNINRF